MNIKFICLVSLLFNSFYFQLLAQEEKTVTLTVSGQGKTKDEAKDIALRNAIEQAFGSFISAKTEILNDELISDQITSISSGNIISYEQLNESQMPTGGYSTTLKATVSVNKLTSFVQSKGVSVEIKGGLFAMNIKQQLLNEKAEIQIVTNLIGTLHNVLQQSFDYSLEVNDPKSIDGSSDSWEVPMLIKVKPNKNMDFCANYLVSNLKAISLTKSEKENYEKLNKRVYSVFIRNSNIIDTIFLRTENAFFSLTRLDNIWFYTHSFYIDNGIKKLREVGTINIVGEMFDRKKEVTPLVMLRDLYTDEKTMNLNFISSEENVNQVVYYYSDKLSLSELEKINKYQIFLDTTRNEYTNGGYQLKNVQNNCNIILSPNPQLVYVTQKTKGYASSDQTFFEIQTSADSIIKTYNNSMINGHNDWRLASTSEIKSFVDNYVQNNFDNVMFKVKEFYLDTDELKLIYRESHGSHDKFHWSPNAKFLSSSMVSRANKNGEIQEYNILSHFDEFIAVIKDRESENDLIKHKPLRETGYYGESQIHSGIVLLFIVRSNND
jgi:hypothetical protein